ncbi:hypothetical protein [Chlamydia sp. 17-3921]|uniref:hypothetical protein n=1 Tax=Chlamydia sp. 17-3921 TaxID=2675798 RepID=UPI001919A860|nr:hypothetical protein [Chlamydia sp. 17-3921]
MSISSGGNVSGSGNIDPAFLGRQEDPSIGKKSALSETSSTAIEKQEGVVKSGAMASYGTELQVKEAKYRETQKKSSTSSKNRLKGTFSRVKAGVQGFLKGFGSRSSRISARQAEARGEGSSMLPTDMAFAKKKGNRVSPEMMGFFLDSVNMGESSSDISMLSLDSLKSSSLRSYPPDENIDVSETSSKTSFGSFQRAATPFNEETTNLWTRARLGGEIVSSLLDPNAETSSLVRRSVSAVEGMLDISNIKKEEASTAMEPLSSPYSTRSKNILTTQSSDPEPIEEDNKTVSSHKLMEDTMKAEDKKRSREQQQEDQEMLARAMAGLLLKSTSGGVYVATGSPWSSPSTKFPPPKISGIVSHRSLSRKSNKVPEEGRKTSSDFSSSRKLGRSTMDIPKEAFHSSESTYRFSENFRNPDDPFRKEEVKASEFSLSESVSRSSSPVPLDSTFPRESGIGGPLGNDAVSSLYQFDSQRGVSLLAPTLRSVKEYKDLLEEHKGPGGPPDPLVYQYRNISVEPPIIFRSPLPYGGSSRSAIQGKPEASGVHDDGGGRGGFSNQKQKEERESSKSFNTKDEKKPSIDSGM